MTAFAPTREYIYSGGALLAKIDSTGTQYYQQDHLSNRVVTDSNGNTIAQLGHYPFGESWYNATSDKLLFTTYERDAESGNDYAMMRYGVNRLGRFSSPDPLSGSKRNPQSLNHYSYVHNDPVNSIDPSGLHDHLMYACESPNPPFTGVCAPGEEFWGGGGAGTCAYQPGQPCVTMGLEIFDAIAGVPGTYLTQDMYGNTTFGFSVDLYRFVADASAAAGAKGPLTSGWTYFVQNLGSDTIATGFLANKLASAAEAYRLNANFPDATDTITSLINIDIKMLLNRGADPANISLSKTTWNAVAQYVQGNGLGDYWQLVFYNYFMNLGPALPPR